MVSTPPGNFRPIKQEPTSPLLVNLQLGKKTTISCSGLTRFWCHGANRGLLVHKLNFSWMLSKFITVNLLPTDWLNWALTFRTFQKGAHGWCNQSMLALGSLSRTNCGQSGGSGRLTMFISTAPNWIGLAGKQLLIGSTNAGQSFQKTL